MSQYAELFATNAITPRLFVLLSDADLKEIGVVVFGHRKILLHKIAALNALPPPAPESPGLPETIPPASLPENGGGVSSGPSTAPAAPQAQRPVASAPPSVQPLFAPPPGVPPPFVPATPVEMQPAAAPVPAPHAEPPPRKTFWAKLIASKFLFISIVAHLLFGLGATYFIVQRVQAKRKLTFRGGPPSPNPSKRALEHKVSMAKKKTGGAPPQAKRIVSAGISKVSLPEMPTMPTASSVMQGMAAGMGGVGSGQGFGAGGAGGGMGGGGGGGGMTLFGFRGGGGLMGTFYDLKQNPSKKRTPVDSVEKLAKELSRFTHGGWNQSFFDQYFKAPTNLSATNLFVPFADSEAAPEAFGVKKFVDPSLWMVFYKGRVSPPESGTWYFVGGADNFLIVRLNGKVVLHSGYPQYESATQFKATAKYLYEGFKFSHGPAGGVPGGFAKGAPMQLQAGQFYDMEMVIGDDGGLMFFTLLIEKEGVQYERDGSGNPILPPFRLGNAKLPEGNQPPHRSDGPIWREKSSGGSLLDAIGGAGGGR